MFFIVECIVLQNKFNDDIEIEKKWWLIYKLFIGTKFNFFI